MEKLKIKLKQLFCKHKNKQRMRKKEKSEFQCISGEKIYLVCKDCRKVLDETFIEYEGMGWR